MTSYTPHNVDTHFSRPQFAQDRYANYQPPQQQPREEGLMDIIAKSLGGGLGEGVAGGIQKQMKQSMLDKMLGSIDPNISSQDRQRIGAYADPETRDAVTYYDQLQQQRQEQEQQRRQAEAGNRLRGGLTGKGGMGGQPGAGQAQSGQGQAPEQGQMGGGSPYEQLEQEKQAIINAYPELGAEDQKFYNKRLSQIQDAQRELIQSQAETGFKRNEDFRKEINDEYKNYRTKEKLINNMERLNATEDLGSPAMHQFLHSMGYSTGLLDNPSAEEYEKFSQQFMNDISSVFPGRILDKELQSYAKQIPTLLNTSEGRTRILKDLKGVNQARKIRYDVYKDISRNGTYFPPNLQELVTEESENRLQKIEDDLHDSAEYFKPIRMTKDGRQFDIPASKIMQALTKGFKLQQGSPATQGTGFQGSVN